MTEEERQDLFKNTAEKTAMPPAIIEKDFWVINRTIRFSETRNNQTYAAKL